MKKLLFCVFCIKIIAYCNLYAESNNTDDEWLKEMQNLDNQIKEEKVKQNLAKAKTIEIKKKTEGIKKLRKTVDELGKQVGVD